LNPDICDQIKIIKEKTEPIVLIDEQISEKKQKLGIRAEKIDYIEEVEIAD
jgi:hypothetical protein